MKTPGFPAKMITLEVEPAKMAIGPLLKTVVNPPKMEGFTAAGVAGNRTHLEMDKCTLSSWIR